MGKLIGISGRAGSGKDTVAGLVPGSRRFSFADPLKEFCQQVFGWDRETLWGPSELRNKPDERYPRECGYELHQGDGSTCPACRGQQQYLTPRYALQTLGTEWGRHCFPDVWAQLGVRRAQEWLREHPKQGKGHFSDDEFGNTCYIPPSGLPSVAVFSDCRFVNEARAIHAAGGEVWRVVRPGAGLAGGAGLHPSEAEQESPEFLELVTLAIDNSGSLEQLASSVRKATIKP